MIKEVQMFTVVCDNCGADAGDDSEFSAWSDKDYAVDCAMESEWHIDNEDNHYCENCWTYDDEGEVVIKPKKSK